MRTDTGDLLVDDLILDPLQPYKIHVHFREGMGALPNQPSPWTLREFFHLHDFHRDRIYHDFFHLFSPDHVFIRRSIYSIHEGRKKFLGSALHPMVTNGISVLSTRDIPILFDQRIVEALSVLFFLNQSYSQLENIFIDLMEQYKITRFDLVAPDRPLTDTQYYSFLTDSDQNNAVVSQFLRRLAEYTPIDSSPFFKKRELSLLNMVIAPDFDQLFDFSESEYLKTSLFLRKQQLREILLCSERFSAIIFQLTTDDLQDNLTYFFYCLKQYDEKNFSHHRDTVIKNYILFFLNFLK